MKGGKAMKQGLREELQDTKDKLERLSPSKQAALVILVNDLYANEQANPSPSADNKEKSSA